MLPGRELTNAMRWHILWSNATYPGLMLLAAWGGYLAARMFDVDLLHLVRGRQQMVGRERDAFYWYMAVVCTPILVGMAAFYLNRAMRLALFGVEVQAIVKKIRSVGFGYSRVDCQYEYEGKTYRKALSTSTDEAQQYADGSLPLILVCDPTKPKRAMERADVFPPDMVMEIDEIDADGSTASAQDLT